MTLPPPGAVFVADLGGDGLPDLLVPDWGDDRVHYFKNVGNAQFLPPEVIATGDSEQGRVVVLPNNGSGAFSVAHWYDGGDYVHSLAAGQFLSAPTEDVLETRAGVRSKRSIEAFIRRGGRPPARA